MKISSRPWAALLIVAASTIASLGMLGVSIPQAAHASSHSDAPLSKMDPQTNLTDVYAFIRTRPSGERVLVCEVSVRPFSEPGDGVLYDAFADDARYSIHITDPNTGAETRRYDFRFSAVSSAAGAYKNLDTILRYGRGTTVGAIQNVGDSNQNFTQTYTVTQVVNGTSTVIGSSLMVPPYNSGPGATPLYNDTTGTPSSNPNYGRAMSGASSRAGLDTYTRQTTYDLPAAGGGTGTGTTVFCGSREDGFYADTPGIFDLLNSRILTNNQPAGPMGTFGQQAGGVDGFKGFNVLHYAIVIPLTDLNSVSYQAPFTNGGAPGIGARTGVGVYASVSRPRITLRSATGDPTPSGPDIQVNREANPLFNEVLVAMRDKDKYNRTSPTSDADPVNGYAKYALNPEVAVLINTVYGTNFATTGRVDLQAVYIPDVIRVDTTTGPARVSGTAGFNRLGFLGGDTLTTSSGATIPGGWPNGRRFGDDVADVALTAVASGPTYSAVTLVGDNIAANDQVYNQTFPYAGTPHSGVRNSKDSGPNVGF